MISSKSGPELQMAAVKLLRDVLCVQKDESVLITSDCNADAEVVQAVRIAAHMLEAKPVQILLDPPLPLQGLLADPYIPEPVISAVLSTDLWFDLTLPYMAGSKAFDSVMRNRRTRYFLAGGMDVGAMIRMYSKFDMVSLMNTCADLQAAFSDRAGEQVRITCPLGTDVVFNSIRLPESDTFRFGRATRPGGYFAPGAPGLIPAGGTVKGVIVVEAVQHDYYVKLDEPFVLEVDGTVQSLRGGGTEWAGMDRALRRAANGGYGGVVHFTCGVHPGARYLGESFAEDSRVTGSNAVGFGFPPGTPGGGENHPDGVIQRQSIWIGGDQFMKDGFICAPQAVALALQALSA